MHHSPESIYRRPKKLIPSKDNSEVSDQPKLGNFKDELFLISFMILCSGLVFTDSYYQTFGLKYQFLNLPVFHIIYRGLTMITKYPAILLPYLLTIFMVMFEIYSIRRKIKFFLANRIPIAYMLIIINLMILYPVAIRAGEEQAILDMTDDTSTLPRIENLKSDVLQINRPLDNYRLFINDGDFIFYFSPRLKGENSIPVIKRLAISKIDVINTSYQKF